MKWYVRVILILSLLCCSIFPVLASEVDTCLLDDYECLQEYRKSVAKNDFAIQGIVSFDKEEMLEEMTEDYVVYFSSTADVPNAIDLDVFNLGNAFIGLLFVGIISLFEQLGLFVSWLVMIVYNFAGSGIIALIIREVGSMLNELVFDWKNVDGTGVILLIAVTMITILTSLLRNFKAYSTNKKNIFQDVLAIVVNAFLIYFVALHGHTIAYEFESRLTDSMGEIMQVSFDEQESDSVAVQTKNIVFDLMQMQPYMLRNFGTMNAEDIKGGMSRVYDLLDGTTTVDEEIEDYDNQYIIQDAATATQNLFFEFLIIIQRVLMAIIIGGLTILFLAFQVVKELLLLMAVLNVVKLLFNPKWSIFDWFIARVIWAIAAVFVSVGFTIILHGLFSAIAYVTSINVLFLLVFDAVVVYILSLIRNNWDLIAEKFMRSVNSYRNLYTGTEGCMEIVDTIQQMHFESPAETFGLSGREEEASGSTSTSSSVVSPLHNQAGLADVAEEESAENYESIQNVLYDTVKSVATPVAKMAANRKMATSKEEVITTQPHVDIEAMSASSVQSKRVTASSELVESSSKTSIKPSNKPTRLFKKVEPEVNAVEEELNSNAKGSSIPPSASYEENELKPSSIPGGEVMVEGETIRTTLETSDTLAEVPEEVEMHEEIAEVSVDQQEEIAERVVEDTNDEDVETIEEKRPKPITVAEEEAETSLDATSSVNYMSDEEMEMLLEEDAQLEFLGDQEEDGEWYD